VGGRRRKLDLVVLVEGDPALINPYGAILVNPERHQGLNADGAHAPRRPHVTGWAGPYGCLQGRR
jgi:hypothetical protein